MAIDDLDELLAEAISALRTGGVATTRGALSQPPFHCVPSADKTRRIIYSTKCDWLLNLAGHSIPNDVTLLWRYGPLGPRERAFVRGVADHFGASVYFVGDLDPLDLATYATLVADPAVASAAYLGISASWLDACRADLAKQARPAFQLVCIAMDAAEREGWQSLRQIGVDWSEIIGASGLSLLDSGLKLELEGASTPALYSSAFTADLVRALFA
jgi:hypothetical protein